MKPAMIKWIPGRIVLYQEGPDSYMKHDKRVDMWAVQVLSDSAIRRALYTSWFKMVKKQ